MALVVSTWCQRADGANVILIRLDGEQQAGQQELSIASRFYGVDIRELTPGAATNKAILGGLVDAGTVAVAIEAGALSDLNRSLLFKALQPNASTPVLIFGIMPQTRPELLSIWSGGAVTACRRMESRRGLSYRIQRVSGVTKELSDVELPFAGTNANYLGLFRSKENGTQIISTVQAGGQVAPVFIETPVGQVTVFLESQVNLPAEDFAEIAPAMLFTKYCAASRGWHAIRHYANLTVDDPWLREPYGFVNYSGLLREMVAHNFHTTIAFIPWNYDRSEPEVATLFRANPDRLSIAIHGNNHDHKEFTDYRKKPLGGQIANLRQSLARMDQFHRLTRIPYDKVMIFPHSIAPEQTLMSLRENGYLATVNSSNVPMGAVQPNDPLFSLRAATLAYGGSLSLRRYSVEGPLSPEVVPLNLFLDNPVLFYCHHEFFSSGIGAFDAQADQVNSIDPGVRWRGLGDISRHMYLVKQRDDGEVDVLSFTPEMSLENPSGRSVVFHIRKQQTGRPYGVSVDGQPWPYSLEGGYVEMRVPMSAGKRRLASISYGVSSGFGTTDIDRRSTRVYLLRMASDFRDIRLARFAPGLWFIRLYQQHGRPLGLLSLVGALIVLIVLAALWRAWAMLRGRRRSTQVVIAQ